jgi:hypothetical protein
MGFGSFRRPSFTFWIVTGYIASLTATLTHPKRRFASPGAFYAVFLGWTPTKSFG